MYDWDRGIRWWIGWWRAVDTAARERDQDHIVARDRVLARCDVHGPGLVARGVARRYVAVVPLVAILFGDEDDRREWADEYLSTDTAETDGKSEPTDSKTDALETLRERYAAGDLTDEQFERKLERLLDTETLAEAQE